jgi:radical SAM superfamily enzyme YgiQ (UPF0313 family)
MIFLVNPPIYIQKNDPHTGIPYMPFILAYLAAYLQKNNIKLKVIDAYAEQPGNVYHYRGLKARGLEIAGIGDYFTQDQEVYLLVLVRCVQAFDYIKDLSSWLKNNNYKARIIAIENNQAVSSFSLRYCVKEMKDALDFAVLGEAEITCLELLQAIKRGEKDFSKVAGLVYKKGSEMIINPERENLIDLGEIPPPAWDLFPLENYWQQKVAHGPFHSSRYLAVLSSRGCPFKCRFCVIPDTNHARFRAKSAKGFADELEFLSKRYNVTEFHLEDVNASVKHSRIQELCEELIRRTLNLKWKLVSGIKIETLTPELVALMARAGCDYISFSPETGSKRLISLMNKPFNFAHTYKVLRAMTRAKINTQACYVLGFPGENRADIKETRRSIFRLVRNGISEIAVFIITPVPGSDIFKNKELTGYSSLSELSFSPLWRKDYKYLKKQRLNLYLVFFLAKILCQPLSVFIHIYRLLRRRFHTKMEMVAYRTLGFILGCR